MFTFEHEFFLFLSHNMKIANRKMLKSAKIVCLAIFTALLMFKHTAKR
ncbi:hypothetical protein P20495_0359 [Pseudoalteromonas sp. BSi20495]|nr:hypothetical protein P20495_0359 [Pseudoalteromonas sp. BSi20495]